MPRVTIANMMRGVAFAAVTAAVFVAADRTLSQIPSARHTWIAHLVWAVLACPLAWTVTALVVLPRGCARDLFVLANLAFVVFLILCLFALMTAWFVYQAVQGQAVTPQAHDNVRSGIITGTITTGVCVLGEVFLIRWFIGRLRRKSTSLSDAL